MASTGRIVQGVPVAPGYGEGKAFLYRGAADLFRAAEGRRSSESDHERQRYEAALAAARRELRAFARRLEQEYGGEDANILHAQFFMLDDPALRAEIERGIEAGLAAEAAVVAAVREVERRLRAREDPYLRERAADVRDIGARLLRHLTDRSRHPLATLAEPSVVVAEELLPSDTVCLDRHHVVAIVTERGSELGHAAILARSLGVPAVVRAAGVLEGCRPGDRVAVDGLRGRVLIRPAGESERAWARSAQAYRRSLAHVRAAAHGEVRTRDGVRVQLLANVGCIEDAQRAAEEGAEGIGLVRTELLAWRGEGLAGEEEQSQAYAAVVRAMGGRPVTMRVFDIGPDKVIPVDEELPAGRAGVRERGIAFALRHPDLLRAQLRAILRASREGPVRLLLPMVTRAGEVAAVRRLLAEEAAGVGAASLPPVGAMIESPVALLLARELALEADFVAIGSNDLLAGLFGCVPGEDGEAGVTPFEPGLVRAVRQIVEAAGRHGREVSLCGEIAGDPAFTELLLGLGLRILSANPSALAEVRYTVRAIDAGEARELAERALAAATAEEVRRIVQGRGDPWRRLLSEAERRSSR